MELKESRYFTNLELDPKWNQLFEPLSSPLLFSFLLLSSLISSPHSQTLTLVIPSHIRRSQSCDLSCQRQGRLAGGILSEGTLSLHCLYSPFLLLLVCLYIRTRVVSSSPLSQSSSSKSKAMGLNVLWEHGGHVFNPRWKQVKWLKSRWILHLIHIIT